MILSIFILCVSLFFIVKGADWFTDASVAIAEIARVPKIVIGATIVAFATTLPEFTVSISSAGMGHTDIAFGNAIGSCTCNIGLVLGLSWLIGAKIVYQKAELQTKLIFMIGSGILALLLSFGFIISRIDGLVLVLVLVFYGFYIAKIMKKRSIEMAVLDVEVKPQGMRNEVLLFILGALCVVGGSRGIVKSGIDIARALGVSELAIGLTIVAGGTSLPELATAIASLIKGHHALSMGNIIGANFLDIVWVLGVVSIIRPVPISYQSILYDLPIMLLVMVATALFVRLPKFSSRLKGGVILLIYGVYVFGLFHRA
ncbi:MAG: calcium/sodium antiporter [bacterium]|nr:calcium/sodium antiporter [bacterium]